MAGEPAGEAAVRGRVDGAADHSGLAVAAPAQRPVAVWLRDRPARVVGGAGVDGDRGTQLAQAPRERRDPRLRGADLGRVVLGEEGDAHRRQYFEPGARAGLQPGKITDLLSTRRSRSQSALLVVVTTVVAVARLMGALRRHASESAVRSPADPRPRRPVEKAIWGPLEMPDGSLRLPDLRRTRCRRLPDSAALGRRSPRAGPTTPATPPTRPTPGRRKWMGRSAKRPITGSRWRCWSRRRPGWANGGRAEIRAPDDVADYAVSWSPPRAAIPSVKRWMVWGEPNRSDRFLPNAAKRPGRPAPLRGAARQRLRSAEGRLGGERRDRRHDLHRR